MCRAGKDFPPGNVPHAAWIVPAPTQAYSKIPDFVAENKHVFLRYILGTSINQIVEGYASAWGSGCWLSCCRSWPFSRLLRLEVILDTVKYGDQVQAEKLQPLYVAREALATLDEQRAIYLAALKSMTTAFKGDAGFDRVNSGLLKTAEEPDRPRKYRAASQMLNAVDMPRLEGGRLAIAHDGVVSNKVRRLVL